MANVWGFPYKLTANGGGYFTCIFNAFIVIFSYLGLSAEYAIGRRAKTGTIGIPIFLGNCWNEEIRENHRMSATCRISLHSNREYTVIISYVMKSLFQAVTGSLMTVNTDTWFNSFAFNGFCINLHHSDRSDFYRAISWFLGYG